MGTARKARASETEIQAFKELLARRDTAGKELARIWGVHPSVVSRRLSGSRTVLIGDLQTACQSLGISVEGFRAECEAVERRRLFSDTPRIGPFGTALDFAQVRQALALVTQAQEQGAFAEAGERLQSLRELLGEVDPIELPWVDWVAGTFLNLDEPATGAAAFGRAADGFFRAWMACKYEQARSYMLAAHRHPEHELTTQWTRRARGAFEEVIGDLRGDARIRGDVCKTYGELLSSAVSDSDATRYGTRLFEAAKLAYQLALDNGSGNDPAVQAECQLNLAVCELHLENPSAAVTRLISALELRCTQTESPHRVAYVLKYLAIAHLALAKRAAPGTAGRIARETQFSLAGWCSVLARRMYDLLLPHSGDPPDTGLARDRNSATYIQGLVFRAHPELANRLIPSLSQATPTEFSSAHKAYGIQVERTLSGT